MDTISLEHEGQTFEVPLVVAFDPSGPSDLIGDIQPEDCDHSGATWSSCLDLRCYRCGVRLFMPPRFLARRSEGDIESMHAEWRRAGWPGFHDGKWSANPKHWTVIAHPLFPDTGLAVRNDRLDSFAGYVS